VKVRGQPAASVSHPVLSRSHQISDPDKTRTRSLYGEIRFFGDWHAAQDTTA